MGFNAIINHFDGDICETGPLAGVTFTVKGNIDVAGQATTHGMKRFVDNLQERDAPVVARLRAAGATPIGHTNLPTMNVRGMHTRSEFGDTINPWDATKTPGGSSGGCAVAVATGETRISIGSDGGGSLRIPALFNGVCSLKPSYGRYPQRKVYGNEHPAYLFQEQYVEGPVARSVADLRLVHPYLCGASPVDPRVAPVPVEGPPLPRRAGVVAGAEQAAETLANHGYEVAPVELPRLAESVEAFHRLAVTAVGDGFDAFASFVGEDAARTIALMLKVYEPYTLAGFFESTSLRLAVRRAWAELFERYPVIVAPVSTVPSFEPDEELRGPDELVRYHDAVAVCAASSFAGVPAVAVPTGLHDGFPTGVQVLAPMYREDVAMDAAEVIEVPLQA
ncbi:amidase [Lentzea sp. NBRC 105346]|uniref:amidase n=1 Tax=Lentzea sp. NBRC 105346 TaxID=3032205 RepID=UPI0024A0F2E3|nr:amidase family protein [Lentzea sp. NBRC 105346]GLZ36034.1 amidase [Lentzea sp. NBRC 105346]